VGDDPSSVGGFSCLPDVETILRQQTAARMELAAIADGLVAGTDELRRCLDRAEANLKAISDRLEGLGQELRRLREGLMTGDALRESLVITGCLAVLDDLRRAWAACPAEAGGWGSGVGLVLENLEALITAAGVEVLRAVPGQPFETGVHRAVLSEGESAAGPAVVLAEIRPGYRSGSRLIRPVEVQVGWRERLPTGTTVGEVAKDDESAVGEVADSDGASGAHDADQE